MVSDATDSRPSINGAGGAFASRRMVWGRCLRAMARRRRRLPDLRISAPSVVARVLARARDATDFRPSINGAGGAFASRHTVCESSRERWRDGAGCLPDLRISAPSGFACILVWASDATDSRPSRSGGATVPVAAHRLRACQRWRTGAVGSQTSEIR